MRLTDLPTPSVLIEQSRLARNIDRMQAAVDATGRRLRPHAKTHKSIAIARQQLTRGARGITCAKLGEAEVFAAAGIEDIRVAYPLNPVNIARVLALTRRTTTVLHRRPPRRCRRMVGGLAAAGRTVDVLVKVDVGLHRCGIDPGAPDAARFVAEVANLPGLRFRGLLSHAGHAYARGLTG